MCCFQNKTENRRNNKLTLKMMQVHKTQKLNMGQVRVFGCGPEIDEREAVHGWGWVHNEQKWAKHEWEWVKMSASGLKMSQCEWMGVDGSGWKQIGVGGTTQVRILRVGGDSCQQMVLSGSGKEWVGVGRSSVQYNL